jgi:hypothetical protein
MALVSWQQVEMSTLARGISHTELVLALAINQESVADANISNMARKPSA